MKTVRAQKRLKTSGQIMVAIMFSAMLFAGGTYMWSYLHQSQLRSAQTRAGTDIDLLMSTIAYRIKSGLRGPYSAAGGCPDYFSTFRDFTPPATTAPLTWTPAVVTKGGSLSCIISASESDSISSLTINLTRLGSPNLNNLTNIVNLEMVAITDGANSFGFQTTKRFSKNFTIRIVGLNYFNIVLVPPGPGATSIPSAPYFEADVSNVTSSLEINGSTFYAAKTSLPLSDLVGDLSSTKVVFNKLFYMRPTTISAETATELDVGSVRKVFKLGVETGIFSNVSALPVPSDTPSLQNAWNQPTSYRYQWSTAGGPLPDMSYLTTPLGGGPYTSYVNDATQPTWAYNALDASVNLPPVPGPPTVHLADSCSSGLNPPAPLVYQRYNQDLTLTFQNPALSSPIFCGMIFANQLTIVTTVAGDYALFGNFLVSKIRLQGPGKIYFFNPAENYPLPSTITLPTGQNQYGIFNQLSMLSTSWGRNFFMPLFVTPLVGPNLQIFSPQRPDTAPLTNGWMVTCPPGPATNTKRCINPSPTAPDYSTLFPAAVNQLAFIVEEST